MWTAPSLQGFLQRFDQIACVHMSGLSVRSHMNAGQDGFRDKGSKQHYDLRKRPLGLSECPVSWIDRSHHLLIILQVLASAQHGCSSVAPRVWPISRPRLPSRRHRFRLCIAPLSPSTSIGCVSCRSQMVERMASPVCAGQVGGHGCRAVGCPRQHHLPSNACRLVGERHGGQLWRLALEKRGKPG